MFQDEELHWVTLCLCLFSTGLSVAIQPACTGRVTSDLKRNLLRLSPISAGILLLLDILRCVSLKVLNFGDLDCCIWFTAQDHFKELGHGMLLRLDEQPSRMKYNVARWTFFGTITAPLYIRLLLSKGSPWTKLWTTCFLLQFLTHEYLWPYVKHRHLTLQISGEEWPAKPFTRLRYDTESSTGGQDPYMPLDPDLIKLEFRQQWNACEGIKSAFSAAAEMDRNKKEGKILDKHTASVAYLRMFALVTNRKFTWTCGHIRCLVYKISCRILHYGPHFWLLATLLFLAWLIHADLRFFSILLCEKFLENRTAYTFTSGTAGAIGLWFWLIMPNIIVHVTLVLVKKCTVFGCSLASTVDFIRRPWLKVPLLILVYSALAYYTIFCRNIFPSNRPNITATAIAWCLEVLLLIALIWIWIKITEVFVHEEIAEADQSRQELKEKVQTAEVLDSNKSKEKSAQSKSDDENLFLRYNLFVVLMVIPATIIWFAFCNQPATLSGSQQVQPVFNFPPATHKFMPSDYVPQQQQQLQRQQY